MAKYFNKFPLVHYTLDDGKSFDVITNIVSRFGLERKLRNNALIYYSYEVGDGETPEIIATKIYNSPERHWIVLLANNIMDVESEWPMDNKVLINYIDKKYRTEEMNGLDWAKTNVHSYYRTETISIPNVEEGKTVTRTRICKDVYDKMVEDAANYPFKIVDDEYVFSTMHDRPTILHDGTYCYITVEKSYKTYMEYELDLNESKRNIVLFRNEFVIPLEEQLKDIFNQRRV